MFLIETQYSSRNTGKSLGSKTLIILFWWNMCICAIVIIHGIFDLKMYDYYWKITAQKNKWLIRHVFHQNKIISVLEPRFFDESVHAKMYIYAELIQMPSVYLTWNNTLKIKVKWIKCQEKKKLQNFRCLKSKINKKFIT